MTPPRALLALLLGALLVVPPFARAQDEEDDASLSELKGAFKEEIESIEKRYPKGGEPDDEAYAKAAKILEDIAALGSRRAAYFINEALQTSLANAEVQVQAFEAQRLALGKLDPEGAGYKYLVSRVKRRSVDWKERVDIIYALRTTEDKEANELLLSLTRDSKDEVAGAALRALAYRKCTAAMDTFIKVMAKHESKKDRHYLDARQCLTAVTGYDFASSREWKEWWEKVEESFDPETQRGKARLFFPEDYILSQAVVMVLDTSSSMSFRDPEGGIQPGVDQTRTRLPVERERLFRGKRRMQTLLKTLRKGARFNIIHFNNKAQSWQHDGLLVRIDDGAIESGLDYLEGYKPNGLSNAIEGFEEAFKCEDADTILYMSDGIPSDLKGKRLPYLGLLAEVRNLNRHRNIRVFCVSFKGADRGFMVNLAAQNGGGYQEIP